MFKTYIPDQNHANLINYHDRSSLYNRSKSFKFGNIKKIHLKKRCFSRSALTGPSLLSHELADKFIELGTFWHEFETALIFFEGVLRKQSFEMVSASASALLDIVTKMFFMMRSRDHSTASCIDAARICQSHLLPQQAVGGGEGGGGVEQLTSRVSQVYSSLAELLRYSDLITAECEFGESTPAGATGCVSETTSEGQSACIQSVAPCDGGETNVDGLLRTVHTLALCVKNMVIAAQIFSDFSTRQSDPAIDISRGTNVARHSYRHAPSSSGTSNCRSLTSLDSEHQPPAIPRSTTLHTSVCYDAHVPSDYMYCTLRREPRPPLPPKRRLQRAEHGTRGAAAEPDTRPPDAETFSFERLNICSSLCNSLDSFTASPDMCKYHNSTGHSSISLDFEDVSHDSVDGAIEERLRVNGSAYNNTNICLHDLSMTSSSVRSSSSAGDCLSSVDPSVSAIPHDHLELVRDALPPKYVDVNAAIVRRLQSQKLSVTSSKQKLSVTSSEQKLSVTSSEQKQSVTSFEQKQSVTSFEQQQVHNDMYYTDVHDNTKELPELRPTIPPKRRHVESYMQVINDYYNSAPIDRHSHFSKRDSTRETTLCSVSSQYQNIRADAQQLAAPLLPPKRRLCRQLTPVPRARQLTSVSADSSPRKQPQPDPVSLPLDLLHVDTFTAKTFSLENDSDDVVYTDNDEIRGLTIDYLLHCAINEVTQFQDVFVSTYRLFVGTRVLIDFLISLYNHYRFKCGVSNDGTHKSRKTFYLIVRVVAQFSLSEMDHYAFNALTRLQILLLRSGDIVFARVLRTKVLEILEWRHSAASSHTGASCVSSSTTTSGVSHVSVAAKLIKVRARDLAQQMTLVDWQAFRQLPMCELLHYARHQAEDISPHLSRFTKHFNSVSFWARTQLLLAQPKNRTKLLCHLISVLKHLRRLNNFNSYLALLAAVDSPLIRRLKLPRFICERIDDHLQLMDPSNSFRAYRNTIADVSAPCIPYLGLVLHDLTFVDLGNTDYLGSMKIINVAKLRQQHDILHSVHAMRKKSYKVQKNHDILKLFNNFSDYLEENDLIALSENIRRNGTA